MEILATKPGHDGSFSLIRNGRIEFCLESEKDSHTRYAPIHPMTLVDALCLVENVPDVLAVGGWYRGPWIDEPTYLSGYFGCDSACRTCWKTRMCGKEVLVFSSSHERSHLLCAYGLSPFDQGTFCYALVWEGQLGALYQIDEGVQITKLADVMPGIGDKYLYFYNLAHSGPDIDFAAAGKLMALAGFSNRAGLTPEERRLVEFVVDDAILMKTPMSAVSWSTLFRAGVENQRFRNAAGVFSDVLFGRFFDAAKQHVTRKAPLLISGGCGLNCDWNTRWLESGLFSDVFVPPCANDSGSGIGTGIDAQHYLTGSAKVDWSVYCGASFVNDVSEVPRGFRKYSADSSAIAKLLADGKVLGWVQGRAEIGPRALGHRSIIAEPFNVATRDRLNQIKQRESYRPIAPVCIAERVEEYFDWRGPSPHMLHFQRVKSAQLRAITHIDGTARVQTLTKHDCPLLYDVLEQFHAVTGAAVLCNTSLNARGRGFVNRMSDLADLSLRRGIDGFVIEDALYVAEDCSLPDKQ